MKKIYIYWVKGSEAAIYGHNKYILTCLLSDLMRYQARAWSSPQEGFP